MSHRQAVCRRGVVLVQVALMLTVLLGFVALSADAGLLLSERRHGQATADAAALAAASDLYAKYLTNKGVDTGGTAKAAALSVASANGYTNNTTTSVVSVRTSGQTYWAAPTPARRFRPATSRWPSSSISPAASASSSWAAPRSRSPCARLLVGKPSPSAPAS